MRHEEYFWNTGTAVYSKKYTFCALLNVNIVTEPDKQTQRLELRCLECYSTLERGSAWPSTANAFQLTGYCVLLLIVV